MKDEAYNFAVNAPADQQLNEMQSAMYDFYRAMIKKICLFFYKNKGQDFYKFLDVLVRALQQADWNSASIRRFTINFSRDLGSTVRYALCKKRAAAEERRRERKAKKAKR